MLGGIHPFLLPYKIYGQILNLSLCSYLGKTAVKWKFWLFEDLILLVFYGKRGSLVTCSPCHEEALLTMSWQMLQYSTGWQNLNLVCTWKIFEYSCLVKHLTPSDLRKCLMEYLCRQAMVFLMIMCMTGLLVFVFSAV